MTVGENSAIEWTDHTMNFWVGCTKVSPACDHCYAEAWAKRTGQAYLWNGGRKRTAPANWRKPHKWSDARVFTNSLADFFDNRVPDKWRHDAWDVIKYTPTLTWMILTKRPQNIPEMLPADWASGWHNVWLGITAENQEEYDRRARHLYKVPAAVRFISYEPAIGPLELDNDAPLDWVICGGESGPGARPMAFAWAREMRDQCKRQGICFFMKQIGGKRKPFLPIPDDLMVREFPRVA